MRNFETYLFNMLQDSYDEYLSSDEDEDYWHT